MKLTSSQFDTLALLGAIQNDPAINMQMQRLESVNGTATSADLAVYVLHEVTASALPDGPAPAALSVLNSDHEVIGELMLWVKNGFVDSVEQTWYIDAVPTALPSRDRVMPERAGI